MIKIEKVEVLYNIYNFNYILLWRNILQIFKLTDKKMAYYFYLCKLITIDNDKTLEK